ncbi:hypothetical protein GGTG_03278 [Gaeumannomyces tritici R3-111a-1]|uniref:Uncharacterized protein n=1 Tax=Gaeumannomyces tritici (strain R3-111a-1) TaxID=644352 RepID=J3NPS1_GAET3|nr:hypothetical protein GGTG_03278 [Gaeumannomyces tritici R3-111a-1]EJT78176.1 hypothetical protein GGTG_03278 [Gaeumannomyces tritici R3-111a-1]
MSLASVFRTAMSSRLKNRRLPVAGSRLIDLSTRGLSIRDGHGATALHAHQLVPPRKSPEHTRQPGLCRWERRSVMR